MVSELSAQKVAELLKGTTNVLVKRFDQTDERIDRLSEEVSTLRDEMNERFDWVEDKLLKNHEERLQVLETTVLK